MAQDWVHGPTEPLDHIHCNERFLLRPNWGETETMAELWSFGGLGWRELFRRSWNESWRDGVFGHAARLAFYFFLALLPSLLLFWLVLTKLAEAGFELRNVLSQTLYQILPTQSSGVVSSALRQSGSAIGLSSLALSVGAAVWAALNGMFALITGLNQAYEVEEGRPLWKKFLLALGLLLVWGVMGMIALLLVVFGSRIELFAGGGAWRMVGAVVHWVVAFVVLLVAFAIAYRFGPHLEEAEMRWSTPGAVIGVTIWIASAIGFRLYLERFNSYHRIYGQLDSIAILMLWLYLSGAAILIGGEVNAVIEHAAADCGDPAARARGERQPGGHRHSRRPPA